MASDEELISKYGRLCGHVAQALVKKSSNLTQEDAQDFASAAMMKLIKCPAHHRHEDPYIRTIINNAIRNVWRKRIGQLNAECVPIVDDPSSSSRRVAQGDKGPGWRAHTLGLNAGPRPPSDLKFIISKLSGDGLPDRTQRKFDAETLAGLINSLPSVERTILQLHFGLSGCKSISQRQIAKKLGRSRDWVEPRLVRGIQLVREQVGQPAY